MDFLFALLVNPAVAARLDRQKNGLWLRSQDFKSITQRILHVSRNFEKHEQMQIANQ